MRINEEKFLRFLRNKWFIPVWLGIIVLPAAFLFFTHQDKVYLHKVTDETMRFLRLQVLRYDNFEARSAAVDMTMTTDRAKLLGRAISDTPRLLSDEAYLKDYAYSQRLDGVIVLDAKHNVDAEYCNNASLNKLMLEKAKSANVNNIVQYPFRSYMDQFKYADDEGVYSYAVVGRLDKSGYIVCYRKESTRAEADSQSYLDGLFNSYGFELDGTVMITDGKRVLSSNRTEYTKRELNDLIPDARNQVKLDSDGLYNVEYKGETFYGVVDSYRGYRLSAFFPERAVYADRTHNMIYVTLAYILGCLLFMYLHIRASRGHYRQIRKQYDTIEAISSIYDTVFSLNLETGKIEALQLPKGIEKFLPITTLDRKWMQKMIHMHIKPEFHAAVDIFNDFDKLEKRMEINPHLYVEFQDIDGKWSSSQMIPLSYDDKGKLVSVIIATRDITQDKKKELAYQEQLRQTASEAQRASVAKTDFLRRMSHDIRTPLNGILGLLEMADYYADNTQKLKELRSKVLENTHYLLDLSNDVLEMNKIESGEIHLAKKCFDVVELVRNVGTMTEAQAKMRNLKCERAVEVKHPYVVGSPVHVRQILANLTSNAVKYNKTGGSITLSTRELSCDGKKVWLEFTCADTGIGMSEEFQKHAFDLFAQENNEARTSYLGTGLGLAIVRSLVELMGGTLTFTSKKGEGTTFKVVLPFGVSQKPQQAQGEQETDTVSLKGMKVLVVEDNALNMKIEEFMLEREGAVITKAFNGQEAVNIFADSEPGTFDIILMDIMMPVMDGLTATRTIRALHHDDASTIPIIALSANAFAEDKEESKKAGFTGHLAKPLEAQKLFAVMRKFRRGQE